MTFKTETHDDNVLIGAGALWLDPIEAGAGGVERNAGEQYLGDAASAVLSISEDRVVVMSGSGRERKLVDKPRYTTRMFNLTLRDVTRENLGLLFGTPPETVKAAVRVVDERHVVRRGRWHALREAHGGAVESTGLRVARVGGAVLVVDRDYEVDAAHGRISVTSVADGVDIVVSYRLAADERRIQVGRAANVTAALRYIEDDPFVGSGHHYYAPRCSIRPGGDLSLLSRDTEQQIQLSCEILEPTDGRCSLYIDGEDA